ncbi:hypothetical protein [Nocardia sp. NBC_00403]|uniref:hypothetical protein n=1 Tax=Nocardia sp. NBC_00403 TaxID=2975990 RepID=UPI002E1D3B05
MAAALAYRFDGRGHEAMRVWQRNHGRIVEGAAVLLARLGERYAVALLSDRWRK